MELKPNQITTGEVRISYEHLLAPYAMVPGQEEKFSATLLIPKSDTYTKQRMDAAVQYAIQEGVKGKWKGVQPPVIGIPIYDGNGVRPGGEPFGAERKGCWVITASSKTRQDIVDLNLQPVLNSTEIYSGMYAKVMISFFAYDKGGKRGIGCGLGPVMKTRDGEPLGGRVKANAAFSEMVQAPAYPQNPAYAPPAYPQPGAPVYPAPSGALTVDPLTGRPVVGSIAGL